MDTSNKGLIKEFHAILSVASRGDTEILEGEIKRYRETLNGRPSSSDTLTKQVITMDEPKLPDWLRRALQDGRREVHGAATSREDIHRGIPPRATVLLADSAGSETQDF